MKGTDIDALHLLDDGSILLSLADCFNIPGLGKVDDSDIIRFIPKSLGADSSGSFEMYFDGSDFGLTQSGEDVDAIGFAGDGRLVVSTSGSFKVPQTSPLWLGCKDDLAATTLWWSHSHCDQFYGSDEDLIVLNESSSSWEMYFDGSDVLGRRGDLDGAWLNPTTGDIYLSLSREFTIGSLSGDAQDILVCHPESLGDDTRCAIDGKLFFDGSQAGFGDGRIDGLAIAP